MLHYASSPCHPDTASQEAEVGGAETPSQALAATGQVSLLHNVSIRANEQSHSLSFVEEPFASGDVQALAAADAKKKRREEPVMPNRDRLREWGYGDLVPLVAAAGGFLLVCPAHPPNPPLPLSRLPRPLDVHSQHPSPGLKPFYRCGHFQR